MDEFDAILKARKLVKEADMNTAPVEVERYLNMGSVNVVFKRDYDLPDDQAGSTTVISGRRVIFVNGNHSPERQRFTIVHEVGHIVLGLPSSHSGRLKTHDLFSYQRRPKEEVLCDVFAAELLLPEPVFRKDMASAEIGFNSIESLASKYAASLTSTGSRFALLSEEPCAFVLSEAGKVRYVSSSLAMREQKGWISLGLPIPEETLTANRLKEGKYKGPVEVEAYRWLENERHKGRWLLEDVRLLEQWSQSLTLLWFEDTGDKSVSTEPLPYEEDESALRELDGTLPWPSKRRRR